MENTNKYTKIIIGVVVAVLLVIVIGAAFGNTQSRIEDSANQKIEEMFGEDQELKRLATQYYNEGKTKKEAIQLLKDRGYSKSEAEKAIERYW